MDLGLKGKKALVTGATNGRGRAIAETLLVDCLLYTSDAADE